MTESGMNGLTLTIGALVIVALLCFFAWVDRRRV